MIPWKPIKIHDFVFYKIHDFKNTDIMIFKEYDLPSIFFLI